MELTISAHKHPRWQELKMEVAYYIYTIREALDNLHYNMFTWYLNNSKHRLAFLIAFLLPQENTSLDIWSKRFIVPKRWLENLMFEVGKKSQMYSSCRKHKTNTDYFVEPVLGILDKERVKIDTLPFSMIALTTNDTLKSSDIIDVASLTLSQRIDRDMLNTLESQSADTAIESIFLTPNVNDKEIDNPYENRGGYIVSKYMTEDAMEDTQTWIRALETMPIRHKNAAKWYMYPGFGTYIATIRNTDGTDFINHKGKKYSEWKTPKELLEKPIVYTESLSLRYGILAMLANLGRGYAIVHSTHATLRINHMKSNWSLCINIGGKVVDPTAFRIIRNNAKSVQQRTKLA